MILSLEIIFGLSFIFLFWIFIGYPVFLWLFNKLTWSRNKIKSFEPISLPTVSLIVPTYNESKVIEKKLKNIESLDYPPDKLEIMVIDGSSTDNTVAIINKYSQRIKVIVLEHVGKAKSINQALPLTSGEIIVITDANAFMSPDVLRKITALFVDPKVGAATGAMRQINQSGNAVAQGGGWYWQLEVFMRTQESRLHSVIAMSGEVSAFRRFLFVDQDNKIANWYKPGGTDDFEMTLWAIRQGYKVAYAEKAQVWESAPDNISDFFKQKVRIIVQTIITVRRNLDIIFKTSSYGYLIFVSRKLLPLFSPWLLLLALTSSAILSSISIYWFLVLLAQIIFYIFSILGFNLLRNFIVARLTQFFLLLNLTVLVAWFDYFRGKDYTIWNTISSTRKL